MRRRDGYITVFLSLLLLVGMLFFTFFLELSYLYGAKAKAAAVTACHAKGVFGNYNPDILENYHLFMLDVYCGTETSGYFEEREQERLERNLHAERSGLFSYEVEDFALDGNRFVLEEGFAGLKSQLKGYAKYAMTTSLLEEIKERAEKTSDKELPTGGIEEVLEDAEPVEPDGLFSAFSEDTLLAFVCPAGRLPSEQIVDKSTFPSATHGIPESHALLSLDDGLLAGAKTLVGQECLLPEKLTSPAEAVNTAFYVKQVFPHYLSSTEEGTLRLQQEYILYGKVSDAANLKQVVCDLLVIRFPFNLMCLKKSVAKQALINAVAVAVMASTGAPLPVTEALLNVAAAMGESLLDVKTLLHGERVPLVKTEENWQLSLRSLFCDSAVNSLRPSASETGLDYQDYLSLLCLKQGMTEAVYYRICDMIAYREAQAGRAVNMETMIYGGTAEYKISVLPRFSAWPYARKREMYQDVYFYELKY